MLILEEWEHAVGRGATILGEVARRGQQRRRPPHHRAVAGRRRARSACMRAGARRRRARAGRHRARSTPTARRRRSTTPPRPRRSRKVFGDAGPPVTSTKGVTGHALGAAGALEAAAVLLSMRAPPDPADRQHDERRPRHRPRHRRTPRVGARPDDVEQLRLRRPQRLRHHQPTDVLRSWGPPTRHRDTLAGSPDLTALMLPPRPARRGSSPWPACRRWS